VHSQFVETKLYPALGDLVQHFNNLQSFINQKSQLEQAMPDRIAEIDLMNLHIAFSKVINNDDLMKHLEEIVSFSIPEIQKYLNEGKEIFDFIEAEIELEPVGILPIYRNEGYMLIKDGDTADIQVYEYALQLFSHEANQYRSLQTQYITSYKSSFINTLENIKIDMIRNRKKLPNPATFSVVSKFDFPLVESVLPVAKRMLTKYLQ
jgi:hypothetical protein